ncbi:formin-like protein-like protein [Emiliania huxleyi CCMP1516]|uniref:FH2 domain-containing protein n=2 Tax=Emiliania huxleyi TaxID=2903 RepID=A0A0D3KST6_EMIH1|nr:formin-like protein-like protein [Emiliania huxleyi CCMP1516]EOD38821.1 formin-like protein-like protein [Emiliania huxleyi CCMP1516]|eukprot:XP_005791250.1 formin-like protein-like protein [Emiliania huxleyi CCMP1516]
MAHAISTTRARIMRSKLKRPIKPTDDESTAAKQGEAAKASESESDPESDSSNGEREELPPPAPPGGPRLSPSEKAAADKVAVDKAAADKAAAKKANADRVAALLAAAEKTAAKKANADRVAALLAAAEKTAADKAAAEAAADRAAALLASAEKAAAIEAAGEEATAGVAARMGKQHTAHAPSDRATPISTPPPALEVWRAREAAGALSAWQLQQELGSSVWASVALDAVPIDLAQTEALFARATNVGIFLRKTSKLLSLERLCAAIVSLEASVLEPELLDSVLCNLPAKTWAEEAKALRALKHVPPSSLAAPERFCFEMARLPRLRPMLHALRQKHTLPQALERATAALATVATAARQLMDSPSLRLLLGSVLAHGNYLNAGTRRGGARGVKLEALEKARGVKSADGQHTLLEHACATCGLWRHTLTSELGGVRAACKKSCKLPLLDVIRITIQELEEGVNSVAQEIALCPDLDADVAADASAPPPKRDGGEPSEEERQVALRFRSAMAPFHTDMRRGLDALTAHRDETKTLLKRLAAWLGEDPNRANPNSILKVCADLIDTAIACARVSAEEHKE